MVRSSRRWVATLSSMIALSAQALPSAAENLMDAYQAALDSSPQLAQAKHQLEANRELKPLAQSLYLPHVNAQASAGRNKSYITSIAPGGAITQAEYPSDTYSVTLTQPLFNGQALAAMAQANNVIQASEAQYVASQQALVRAVAQAYFGVLSAKAQLSVANEAEDLLRHIKEQAEESLRVGTGDIISVNEAKARWENARAGQVSAQNALDVAHSQLERLTHRSMKELVDITSFTPLGPNPDDINLWVNQALTNQPLIQQAQSQVKAAQDQEDINRRARWPVISLNGTASHARGQVYPDLTANQATALLTLTVPLFDGGQISAQVGQAHNLARAQEDQFNDIKDQVTLNTRQAFLNLHNSVATFSAAQASYEAAKLSLEGTRAGFGIGTRSMIDLLTTATDYIQAESSYFNARYQQLLSRIELKYAVGILTEEDIQTINDVLIHPHS